jgi:glycogen debranching enzyme
MLYVLDHRFDRQRGLVTGAHTADWGDVDTEDADQNAIYADSRTHWTCDIYDQSMFFGAAKSLAGMFDGRGLKEKARLWEEKAGSIQRNTDRWLWQEDKGFYRVHIHLDSLRHDFDEADIFAMGGNAESILSGLASEEKCRRIIESALARQKSFGISTIGGTLLPPYPKKFFKHPMMDDPYEYQNGGQWDWFGGRIVYAMFEHGFSRQAREKLLEIAKKDVANRGLYEWDSPDGTGRGSAFYSGSAGSLVKALFEGYFGLKIAKDSLGLEPKLGSDSASVHVYIPASDLFAAYVYQFDRMKNKLVFRYNSNIPGPGKIKILIPRIEAGANIPGKFQKLRVKRDGLKIPFVQSESGQDRFVVIVTDFKNHVLEIEFRSLDR